MGKIAADANPLAKTIERRAIGASFQVIEAEMAMDEIANRLYPWPSSGSGAEGLPGEVKQLAVGKRKDKVSSGSSRTSC